MAWLIAWVLIGGCAANRAESVAPQPRHDTAAATSPSVEATAYFDVVKTLCDPAMEGRGVGTTGLERARDELARRFEAMGLEPAFVDQGGEPTWIQPVAVEAGGETITVHNVAGYLGPRDPDKIVVIGAHYDHLGRGGHGSRARRDMRHEIHPGADDNASGVAAMLMVGEQLRGRLTDAGRGVLLIAFSGEERGNWGSRHFVAHPQQRAMPNATIFAMINLDMVGRLEDDPLQIASTDGCAAWEALFNRVNRQRQLGLELSFIGWNVGLSDHAPFDASDIPSIHLFTGWHEDYHRPGDTADKIDVAGAMRIVALTTAAVAELVEIGELGDCSKPTD